MFDRNGFDPFARNRRNSLSKKSKMKQMKQQVAPSIPKQTDFSQVCDAVRKTVEHSGFFIHDRKLEVKLDQIVKD